MQRTKDCLSYIIHKLPAQEATAQAPLHSCANGGYIDTIARDSVLLSGYFYKVYNAQTGVFLRWLPFGPTEETPRMAYSIMTNDNSYVPTNIAQPTNIKTWLYPNPAQEMSYLSVVTDRPENLSIKMYDIAGREIKDIYFGNIDMAKSFEIPLHNLQRGIYLLRIETKTRTKSIKMARL